MRVVRHGVTLSDSISEELSVRGEAGTREHALERQSDLAISGVASLFSFLATRRNEEREG